MAEYKILVVDDEEPIAFNLCIYVYGILYYYNNTNLKYIWLAILFSIVMIKK